MAPAKEIEEALMYGTYEVFTADPDSTTVNKVRQHVEEKLSLDEGFLSNDDWKGKSKELIKEYVGKLLEGWKPEPKKAAKEKPKKEPKQAQPKKSKSKATIQDSDKEDDGEDDEDEETSPSRKRKHTPDEDDPEAKVDESDEYSDVIDIVPTKRKKGSKKEPSSPKKTKPKNPPKKPSGDDDPLEAEIKKLQSQLTKCGVRKLWHNELKEYSDARGKIRHLKQMLSDIGMDGRFSEAKAREIRETRELLADAEAAQEMNKLWGAEGEGRASRNKGRAKKVVISDDEEEEDEEEEEVVVAAKKRARADLAFLGDSESESDSE